MQQRHDSIRRELRADVRGYRNLVLVLLLNALACWLAARVIGGSAFLGEVPHHQPPFIEMDGERVVVSQWLYQFSFWHGASVFFSALWLPLFTALLVSRYGFAWHRTRRREVGRPAHEPRASPSRVSAAAVPQER